jgi:hypothetical protein
MAEEAVENGVPQYPIALSEREYRFKDWADDFLKALAFCGNITLSAQQVGVLPLTVRRRRKRDKAFAKRFRSAMLDAADVLRAAARHRAVNGVVRKLFHKGLPIMDPETGQQYVERHYSDALLARLLQAHCSEHKDDAPVDGEAPRPVTIIVKVLKNVTLESLK